MSSANFVAFIKKNPISVGCSGLSVLLAVGIYFRAGEIPATEATLATKTAEVERHVANIKNSAHLEEQVDTLTEANKEIDSRIISFGQRGLNIQFFNKLAGDTGVKLLNFSQGAMAGGKAAKTSFNPIAFTLSVSGAWPQLIDFLQHLESGERYCRILTANIVTIGGNRNGALTLNLNLELLGRP